MFCVIHGIKSNYTHKIEFCINLFFLLSAYMLRNMYFGMMGYRIVRYSPDAFSFLVQ